jgi:methylphosphotriester-DNA--protein-cysteine methyltransferase
MVAHIHLGASTLGGLIHRGRITLAGNAKLKIYGRLNCKSGKRMKKGNRVFFESQKEAIELGYRPCGHCMRTQYDRWKRKNSN